MKDGKGVNAKLRVKTRNASGLAFYIDYIILQR